MIQFEKLGLFLSKPVALLLVLIYFLQSGLLVYLIRDKFELQKQISFQQERINQLEEKLKIFEAIEDFQIGFTDDEVQQLANVIYDESQKYETDPMFIMAVILTESSFKKGQKSHVGASGLMQVVPFVGRDVAERAGVEWRGDSTLFEPESNIRVGMLHLFEQLLEFGDLKKALVAYNVGETKLRGMIRHNSPIPQKYFEKVMDNYNMLKEKYKV